MLRLTARNGEPPLVWAPWDSDGAGRSFTPNEARRVVVLARLEAPRWVGCATRKRCERDESYYSENFETHYPSSRAAGSSIADDILIKPFVELPLDLETGQFEQFVVGKSTNDHPDRRFLQVY